MIHRLKTQEQETSIDDFVEMAQFRDDGLIVPLIIEYQHLRETDCMGHYQAIEYLKQKNIPNYVNTIMEANKK